MNIEIPDIYRNFLPVYYQYFPPFDPAFDYFGKYFEAMSSLVDDFSGIADYPIWLIERWYWYSDYLHMEYFIENIEAYYERNQHGKSYGDWLRFFGIEGSPLTDEQQKNIYNQLRN